MIRHTVAWTVRGESPEEKTANTETLRRELEALPALVPPIKALQVGTDIGEKDTNWDLVLLVDCASQEDLVAYRVHPEHVRVADIVNSLTDHRMCVDFEF
jgi:hypothetical protein